MTSKELYYQFHLLLNRNAKFENVKVPIGNFVSLYNREKDRWLSAKIDTYNNSDDIIDLQSQYVNKHLLKQISKNSNYYEYQLPEDFFSYSTSFSEASLGVCEGVVYNYIFKNKDKNNFLGDYIKEPSFEYEESLCNISEDKLIVYYKDYEIKQSYLSYYKRIEDIDIEGYVKINQELSIDKDQELDSFYQNQILDLVVTEVMREFGDTKFQLAKERENFKQ